MVRFGRRRGDGARRSREWRGRRWRCWVLGIQERIRERMRVGGGGIAKDVDR